ncbi:Hypothetical protein CINCED_3A001687 [Cinara cedri]|uniref:ABC transporter type 1, transmembrane domain,ABC transporter-like,P-loop containing nucleoside triphosphate n=1 Tax=Cinara cedri TaxID=506608 RepID=A0A5E4MSI1_9HEMI|nr:Hypothetical protein CINCED_3A001687 [Cinara cedri]
MYRLITDSDKVEQRPQHPRANANIFEIFTFSWMLNLFKTGRRKGFKENDLYTTLSEHTSSSLGNELEKRWKVELVNAKTANRKPSLLKVLINMFGSTLLFYGSIQTVVEMILRISRPLLIGGLLSYFTPVESNQIDKSEAFIYAFGLLLNMLSFLLMHRYVQMEMEHSGMKIRVACCSAIYRKALRLSKLSLEETTVGQMINLLSNDVNRFDMAFKFLNFLWIGPLGAIVITYFMWQEIGISSLFGVFTVLMIIPLQVWLGKKTSEFRLKTAPKTDERVKLMNEIIVGIQVIKMYTWEKMFAFLVQYFRKMEIREIRGASYIRYILQSFKIFHTRFALFISILVYIILGNNINTQKVFIIISYYNILMTTMTGLFPESVGSTAEMLISVQRIQSTLSIKSENESNNDVKNGEKDKTKNGEKYIKQPCINFGINVSNASAKWLPNQTENSINNINLTVVPSQLVAIIGPVGAGKSSLIQAILRELPLSKGSISIYGVISYASQEPWLFNGSIKQNIIFSSSLDKERYLQVIKVCALESDLLKLPYGDRTIVGERGVSLSGGQRARINLARAVYKKADIYILDDPLTAVDACVGKHLFNKCINGYLKEKICILVTHQIQYLKRVEKIVLMENASIVSEGSYQELQSGNLDFFKSLESTEKSKITYEDQDVFDKDEVTLNPLPVFSRSNSHHSISTSMGENKLSQIQSEPVEVIETRCSGNVSPRVYLSYIFAGGSVFKILFLLFICIFTQMLSTGGDYWISYWVNLEDHVFRNTGYISTTFSGPINNESLSDSLLWWSVSRKLCIEVYVSINIMVLVVILIRCIVFVSFFTKSSMNLHNSMFDSITRASMLFFSSNSSGRILNRFTKDIGAIDERLPTPLINFINIGLSLIGTLVVVGIINVYLLIPTFFIGIFCAYIAMYYLSTSRSLKRLEGVSRSPVFTHFNETLKGLITIRAFKAEIVLSKEFDEHQDLHSSAWYLYIASNNAFGFVFDFILLIYLSILMFSFLNIDSDTFGGNVGLVITQALNLMGNIQYGIRQSAELENQMTSVERVLEYTNVPQEAPLESSLDKKPPKEWPSRGQIVFQNLCLRYSLDSPYILKNISIKIQPMEKIGIVGRTGAGKSSLIHALFRLALNDGSIIIDGIEIHQLGLHDLRSKLSIIPQDSVLFSGTIRKNLDPFNEYSDHVLWNILEEVQLKDIVEDLPVGLNAKISEGGSNFSVGQKQLLCLARSILRNKKILILDEATANVDPKTDSLIQNIIKKKFQSCTILRIAHRLNTIMDSDKVLVMDAGKVVEFGHPNNLLANKDGFFYKMIDQTYSKEKDTS